MKEMIPGGGGGGAAEGYNLPLHLPAKFWASPTFNPVSGKQIKNKKSKIKSKQNKGGGGENPGFCLY